MAANTPPDAGGAGEARREVRLEERRTLEKWAFIGVPMICPHDFCHCDGRWYRGKGGLMDCSRRDFLFAGVSADATYRGGCTKIEFT